MNYLEHLEAAFLDELDKIAAPYQFFSTVGKALGSSTPLASLAKVPMLGTTAGTAAKRFAVGTVPGAIAGYSTAPEGQGLGGAFKGGLVGGGIGLAGGAALQSRAMAKAGPLPSRSMDAFKNMNRAQLEQIRTPVIEAQRAARTSVVPW